MELVIFERSFERLVVEVGETLVDHVRGEHVVGLVLHHLVSRAYLVVELDRLVELVVDVVGERQREQDAPVPRVQRVRLLKVAERVLVVAGEPNLPGLAVAVADVRQYRLSDPRLRLAAECERAVEGFSGVGVHLALVESHAELIEDHGVGFAQLLCALEVHLRREQRVGAEVLHADVEVRQVAAGEEPSAGPVDRKRLVSGAYVVAFVLDGEGVSDGEPGEEVVFVEAVGFLEELAGELEVPGQEVVETDGVEGEGVFGVVFGEQVAEVVEVAEVLRLEQTRREDGDVLELERVAAVDPG